MDNPESIELRELRAQQAAAGEILRAISRTPADIELICHLIMDKAALLTDTVVAAIALHEGGNLFRAIAQIGTPTEIARQWQGQRFSVGRSLFREHGPWRPLHIADLKESEAYRQGEPLAVTWCDRIGIHTLLAVPLIAQDRLAGTFFVARKESRRFSEKQIELLQSFADQAVVAIENARVLKALDERNKELTESLARQTATSEILRVISGSPNDLAPVFQLILEKSAQLADSGGICLWLRENNLIRCVAAFKVTPEWAVELMRQPMPVPSFRKAEGSWRPFQVPDFRQISLYRDKDPFTVRCCDIEGYRTIMFIPLVAKEELVGTISVARQEIRAFTDAQLDLLKTFADQAVIAIENGRMFREIQAKNEELEVASQHKSEFLANMSHELRTPLNAILGFSEALNDGIFGELNPRQADYLRDIHSSGQHLLSLINDILDLAKVEAGRMELLVEAFDAPSAIESALTLVRERATRHGIRLTLEMDDQLGEFSGDERKFKQVLLNLLSNAVKFTPEGGSVTLNAQATNDGLRVSVRDTGIGIAEEYQEKVFEAFHQAGGSHNVKREGTGLGLTLARQFVEMHGGKMCLESKPGAGSTFTFNMVAQLCPTN